MRSQAIKAASFSAILLLGGCGNGPFSKRAQEVPVEDTSLRIKQLQSELAAKQKQIEKQSEQLAILRGFPADRLEHLVHVAKIEFGRFTRAFDEDEDGRDEGLIVYLLLRDRRSDKIKAAGEVEIELWDLAGAEGRRFLQRRHYGLEELAEYWLGGFLADHYKFKLFWDEESRPVHSNLTLKLHFKEALTGTVFEIQQLIEVSLP